MALPEDLTARFHKGSNGGVGSHVFPRGVWGKRAKEYDLRPQGV